MTKRDKEKKAKRANMREWAKEKDKQWEPTCVKLPEGYESYKMEKCGSGFKADIMPFIVGKVAQHSNQADEGTQHYIFKYKAHNIPGPDGKSNRYACRKEVFGKKCAACDWLTEHGGTADEEMVKQIRSTNRLLLALNDKPGDPKNKPKILDTFYFMRKQGFGEQLKSAINTLDENEDPFDLEGGYTCIFTIDELPRPGGKFNAVTRIDLRQRKYNYPESVVELSPCLDECIIDPGYDAIKSLLEGGGEEEATATKEEDEDERPRGSGKATTKPDDEDEEPEEDSDLEGDEDEEEEEEAPKGNDEPDAGDDSDPEDEDEDDSDLEEGSDLEDEDEDD